MKAFTEKMHNELLLKLEDLDRNYDPKNLTDPRLNLITVVIDKIKEKLKNYHFENEEDEIYYFKKVLPQTMALYIYYSDKIEWDRINRQGSPECSYKFTDRIYLQAENFRKEYKGIYEYNRDEKSHLDKIYFLRKSPINSECKYRPGQIIDPSSPPVHCELLAMNIAYSRLEHEMKMSLKENMDKVSPNSSNEDGLPWTGSKASATELLYGLRRSGLIDNGNASLNKMKKWFEKSFSIDLGNITKVFQDIQSRKMNNNSVFDKLKEAYKKTIDEIDEEYFRKNRPPSGSLGSK
jgi:RteC protein